MQKPLVSVVIVNWNGKDFLEECLPTVLDSDYENFEVILADCDSIDGSVEFVDENYPEVRLIEFDSDPGFDKANNIAVKNHARGKYILFLNNDTKLPENLISKLVKFAEDKGDCVLAPLLFDFKGKLGISGSYPSYFGKIIYKISDIFNLYSQKSPEPFYIPIACCLVKRDVFIHTPFNVNIGMYEDIEWSWKLRLQEIEPKVLENAYCLHKGVGTIGKRKDAYYNIKSRLASHYICLPVSTFFSFLPIVVFENFCSSLFHALKERDLVVLKRYTEGLRDFISDFDNFRKDKNFLEENRKKEENFLKSVVESEEFSRQIKTRHPDISNFQGD